MRIVTEIKPAFPVMPSRKRVAAYARVSSDKEGMLHSLAAQVSYYSGYIQQHNDWEYIGVYADEALTGTKDNRPEFKRLIADCRDGKIDLIITKSISRFARNTVDLLETVREFKQLGIDVYFEEQNIHSMSGDGELMLTILASYAQEESYSVSENCKWRIRKRFEQGEVVGFFNMYGYNITKDGITINEEQATVVRMIFEDYIGGMGGHKIAKKLNAMGVPKYLGGKWKPTSITHLLRNEKYTGNALLQKTFVVDHLTKRQLTNTGQLPRYYAEQTHPAIISVETFEKARQVSAERASYNHAIGGNKKPKYPFTGKILCESCGKNFKRKITNYRHFWQCMTYLDHGRNACQSKQIPESILMTVSAEVLGITEFDEDAFAHQVTEIRVPGANRLIFVLSDGRTVEHTWRDRSRSESWTLEMREEARRRTMERRNSTWQKEKQ